MRSGSPAARAFQTVVTTPSPSPTAASPSHTPSQPAAPGRGPASQAAPAAVRPTSTSPQPEKLVNEAACSMVRRMNERSAIARRWSAGGSVGRDRTGSPMGRGYAGGHDEVKYFVVQSQDRLRSRGAGAWA